MQLTINGEVINRRKTAYITLKCVNMLRLNLTNKEEVLIMLSLTTLLVIAFLKKRDYNYM